jgi:thymidylate synthase (FAD)
VKTSSLNPWKNICKKNTLLKTEVNRLKVKLLAHTQLSENFRELTEDPYTGIFPESNKGRCSCAICYSELATAITSRQRLSPLKVTNILVFQLPMEKKEKRADRLIRHIMNSGHTSTMEHISFTFSSRRCFSLFTRSAD